MEQRPLTIKGVSTFWRMPTMHVLSPLLWSPDSEELDSLSGGCDAEEDAVD